MDELRIHPPPAVGTEELEKLLEAARAALKYLDDLDRHGPADLPRLGGEGRIRRRLRDAIRLCSFEVRPCAACGGGGTVPGPTDHPMERPELAACPECGGSGVARVFSYPRPKTRRGR